MADLKSLGFTSMLGTSGLFYTAVMMAIRFFDGSYAAGGKFHALLPAGGAPVFGVKGANPICFLVRDRKAKGVDVFFAAIEDCRESNVRFFCFSF